MDWFQSLIIGIVQGLTEFIPISSTAHVRIIPALFGWEDPGAAVTAVTQLGTLLAVFVFFRNDIVQLTQAGWISVFQFSRRGAWTEEQRQKIRLFWFIIAGTVPIGICGIVFKKTIEEDFRSLWIISASLIGLAVLLALAEWLAKHHRKLNELTLTDTQIIGWAQAVALIPGSSRSGVTITAGLFLGLSRETAARFSFLLSIPAVLASGLLELKELADSGFGPMSAGNLIFATLAAAVVGYASIAFLLKWLQTRTTWVFILYRVFAGLLIIYLLLQGKIE
jgi:undecaprenyl-diphosphatase